LHFYYLGTDVQRKKKMDHKRKGFSLFLSEISLFPLKKGKKKDSMTHKKILYALSTNLTEVIA